MVVIVVVVAVVMIREGLNAEFDTMDILLLIWSATTTIQTYRTNRLGRDAMGDVDDDETMIRN